MQVDLERGVWRPATERDLPAIVAIADEIHVAYPEDDAIIAERLRLYPRGCALLEVAGKPLAYTLTHPWHYAEPPALNVMLGALPEHATTYYIHDIALLSEVRGMGAAGAIVKAIIAEAEAAGAPNLSLVAVNGSVPFWSRFGFVVTEEPALTKKLLTYDADARFMVRRIAG
ncbi:GNAT family N-acetyltransferase [Hyphomicrobium sp. CS1GBMeth3]|uniref:GNAT family N-acetyltransferase n=1 Tax=Hyphomicrobium sp. CS1GBMeth3 TaxID=1892845 RepID=UPI0009304152|nr:GNAT family N-acetyltransferase [Hyphomicrobium sp. CS1GBMeth3]